MATIRNKNRAKQVTQVGTVTVANTWAQGDTVTLTIDGIDAVVTIGTLVTTDQVATTIKQAFNGETLTDTSASCSPTIAQGGAVNIPQFAELTATVTSSVVTLTGATEGKPVTISVTESTAGSGTATYSGTVTATGASHFSNADNWDSGTVPVDDDAIVFDEGSKSFLYDLSPAIQPASVDVTAGYTGKIGLAETNADDSAATYKEYRTKYLTFDNNSVTTTYTIGAGDGRCSGRVRLDAGAGQSIFNVFRTGTREVYDVPPVLFKGTHSSNEVNNFNGDIGIAVFAGETSTVATLRHGNGSSSSAVTYCGAGVTLSSATVTVNGGTLTTNSAISSVTQTSGTWVHQRGNVTTVNVDGGTAQWKAGSATISTLRVGPSGTFDKSLDTRPLTVTNAVQLYKGATLRDPHGSITFSAGITLNRCTLDDVTLDVGTNKTITVT